MNKFVLVTVLVVAVAAGYFYTSSRDEGAFRNFRAGGGGQSFSFSSVTNTSTSVGIYNWATLNYSGSGASAGFATFCNNADGGVNANNPIYLGFGATSTKPYGVMVESGKCYTMTQAQDNLFYGTVYALASTATTTLLQVYK